MRKFLDRHHKQVNRFRVDAYYHFLLAFLFVLLMIQPLAGRLMPFGLPLPRLVIVAMVPLCALAIADTPRNMLIAGILGLPLTVLWARDLLFIKQEGWLVQAYSLVFFGLVVVRFVMALFQSKRVNAATVSASICAYMLLGVMFTFAYELAYLEYPRVEPFDAPPAQAIERGGVGENELPEADAAITSQGLFYFSIVTLTTLGYGDITPRSRVAQQLAILEALLGQIFLVVLVARLVGLQIAQQSRIDDILEKREERAETGKD